MRFKDFIQLDEWLSFPQNQFDKFTTELKNINIQNKVKCQIYIESKKNILKRNLIDLLLHHDKNSFEHGEKFYEQELSETVKFYDKLFEFNKKYNIRSKIEPFNDFLSKMISDKNYLKSLFIYIEKNI